MPKQLQARAAQGEREERQVRRLGGGPSLSIHNLPLLFIDVLACIYLTKRKEWETNEREDSPS